MQANELFTQPNTILLDGGMGTMLQVAGLKLGARPEELNITDPQLIESIHSRYAAAGSRIINANTFGASAHKLAGSEYTLEEIIAAGIANCKRACAPYGALAALDVGPLGELLEPNGTLAFEDAVAEYGRIVRAGAAAGASMPAGEEGGVGKTGSWHDFCFRLSPGAAGAHSPGTKTSGHAGAQGASGPPGSGGEGSAKCLHSRVPGC